MGIDGIGSSVVIALAAVLWFVYLVPTWLKRREYLATERNAVRLQQTMRIMAESAELPSVVRVEATARTVAAQERALRKQQRSARQAPFPEERVARLEGNPRRLSSARIETRLAARRLRRSRALATLVLLASLVAGGFGISAVVATGSWVLLAASVIVATGAIALLGQAAAVSRARMELRRAAIVVPVAAELHDAADYAVERRPGWTPVPIPKPLYLSRPANDRRSLGDRAATDDRSLRRSPEEIVSKGASPHPDHAAALRAASAEAERALRAAQDAAEVTRIERPAAIPVAPAAQSRFSRMGLVETKDAPPADLDDILRRRRAVG